MDEDVKARFLDRVAVRYGEAVRDECGRVLSELRDDPNPLAVLKLALERVYRDQIEAAASMDVRNFDSDGDL